jgi:hypothetical protein
MTARRARRRRGGKRGRDPGVIIGESGLLIVVAIRRLRLTRKAKSFPLPR